MGIAASPLLFVVILHGKKPVVDAVDERCDLLSEDDTQNAEYDGRCGDDHGDVVASKRQVLPYQE